MRLQWPKQVAPSWRLDIGAGPKCFALYRVGEDRFRRQPVRLTTNLLILVSRGSMIVERGMQRVVIEEGTAALMLPGNLHLTEIPDRVGRVANRSIFFNDRTIRTSLGKHRRAEELATLVYPAHREIYPIRNRWTLRHASEAVFHAGFPAAFSELLCTCSAAPFTFLKHGFYHHAKTLNLWAESQVLSGFSAEQLPDIYPGGRRQFLSHWATYQTLSPRRWLQRRKMELAAMWLRHGEAAVEPIRKALGYECPVKFAEDYAAERGIAPEAEPRMVDGRRLSASVLRQKLRPFWQIDEAAVRQQLLQSKSETIEPVESALAPESSTPESNNNPEPNESGPQPPLEGDTLLNLNEFWDLKSTAVPELLAA
jgi:AraC-like DNA-binding protein